MPFRFDNTYARLPERFYTRMPPHPFPAAALLAVNEPLGVLLGLTPAELDSSDALDWFSGNRIPPGSEPLAQAYAGHQFGLFVPSLGDGRALLLGEVVADDGTRYDLQLKGSGPTPYSRRGDGYAAIGPVLREFLVGEALHALGIPTTRSLAAVATGRPVFREEPLPGAVLTRVARSHLRVGTFEYFACRDDREALGILVDYTLRLLAPPRAVADEPALALFDAVARAQIRLVAAWLGVGFVHGVMNTDNVSLAGETFDLGPCAFLDAYVPGRTYSSIDRFGRYAFMNQPSIALWNLARFADTLQPLLATRGDASRRLEDRLDRLPLDFEDAFLAVWARKLGVRDPKEGDADLVRDLLGLMETGRVDFTNTLDALTRLAGGGPDLFSGLFPDPPEASAWLDRWERRRERERPGRERLEEMRRANPVRIPRNHLVEQALAAAAEGDLAPFRRLRAALEQPCRDDPAFDDLREAPGPEQWDQVTFCGT